MTKLQQQLAEQFYTFGRGKIELEKRMEWNSGKTI